MRHKPEPLKIDFSNDFVLQKIRHELCLSGNVTHTESFGIYQVHMPFLSENRIIAKDGRGLLQFLLAQHFQNGSHQHRNTFERAIIHISSEPSVFELDLTLRSLPEQVGPPNEREIVAAIPAGNETVLFRQATFSDVQFSAWGIENFIYDVVLDIWPHRGDPTGVAGEVVVKYINPPDEEGNPSVVTFQEVDQSAGMKLDMNINGFWTPLLLGPNSNYDFVFTNPEITNFTEVNNEDGIGRELRVSFEYSI